MSYKIPDVFEENEVSNLKLTEDDEIYLIRVPKGFNIEKLHGAEFSPDQVTEIEVEDNNDQLTSVYELSLFSQEDLDVAPLVKSEGKTASLGPPISGLLCVNKSYSVNQISLNHSNGLKKPKPVEMPPGLKQRYTPFGSGDPQHFLTKKKKRKHSSYSQVVTPDGRPSPKKRKIDKASILELENSPNSSQIDSHGDANHCHGKHVKSNSKRYYHVASLSSESVVSNKVNHKDLNHSVNECGDRQESSPKKSHKKSRKRKSSDSLLYIDQTADNSIVPDLLEGHVDASLDDPSVSGEITEISNKVKRKLSSGYYSFSADTSIDSGEISGYIKHKKSPKKKKRSMKETVTLS